MPPIVIAAGIAAGAAVASAKVQSSAASKAAKTQQDATNQALAVQRQANAPYMGLGQQAAQRLGSMANTPQPYTQQFGGPGGSNGVQAYQQPPPMSLSQLGAAPPTAMPRPGTPPMPGSRPNPMPPIGGGGPPSAPMAPQGRNGQMVKMRAPDGSIQMVDAAHVPIYQQKGATVVS